MKFDRNGVKQLHMETSSVCNAACPMCPRELDPAFNKKGVSLSIEKVKTLFSEEFISNLDSMFMCGTYGDPAAAPDTIDIFKYFRDVNPTIVLGMHSNASLRSAKWWFDLGGILSNKADYCYFGIDGLADTNHIYRVNTDFKKIMKNAASFIKAGGQAHWEFLVFQHNEHQVEEARKLSKDMGFVKFSEKISRRVTIPIIKEKVPHIKAPIGERYQ